jgi:hypothetical protein
MGKTSIYTYLIISVSFYGTIGLALEKNFTGAHICLKLHNKYTRCIYTVGGKYKKYEEWHE